MRPSSSSSDLTAAAGSLFGALMARGGVSGQVDDGSWVVAMLEVEAALAGSGARLGLIPPDAATAIAGICAQASPIDQTALGAGAARTGNPVVELLAQLRARLPEPAREHLHDRATSQDVMDTASMLVAVRALAVLEADLRACLDDVTNLIDRHGDAVMIGRTLMQDAVATTFGQVAGSWRLGLDGARRRTGVVAGSLPAQLAGPVGDSVPPALLEAFAAELGLRTLVPSWHTVRLPIADLAGVLALVSGVVAKIALDVVLLAQTEVGEVREGVEGRGGSSTMAHKSNPVAAITARACAARAPGLAATLFASMEQELQRSAGRWPVEWVTLSDLLRSTGSAVAWLHDCLAHLVIDADRMRANAAAAVRPAGPS